MTRHRTNHTARLLILRRLAWQFAGSPDLARIQRDIAETQQAAARDRAPIAIPAPRLSLRPCGRMPA